MSIRRGGQRMCIANPPDKSGSLKAGSLRHMNGQNSSPRNFDRRSDRYGMTKSPGGFMTDQQRLEPQDQSSPGNVEPVRGPMSASVSGLRRQKWQQEQEKEWQCHLRDLQQCICELLIKNQQLRESLKSTTNHKYQELNNEFDQRVARNRS